MKLQAIVLFLNLLHLQCDALRLPLSLNTARMPPTSDPTSANPPSTHPTRDLLQFPESIASQIVPAVSDPLSCGAGNTSSAQEAANEGAQEGQRQQRVAADLVQAVQVQTSPVSSSQQNTGVLNESHIPSQAEVIPTAAPAGIIARKAIRMSTAAARLTTPEYLPDEDYQVVQVGRRCDYSVEANGLLWNLTEGGIVAAAACPAGYQGSVYRPCYSSGLWGASDYTDCRLERLANIRNLIYYHLHNNLIEGLYHLSDDLARYLNTVDIKSPMDRLDTMDTLNSVLQTKVALRLRNGFDIAFVQSLLESVNEILTKKKVEFTSESRKISLMTAKAGEMILSLSTFVDTALSGFRESDLKEVALSASENIVLHLRRKQEREQEVIVYTNESRTSSVKVTDSYSVGSVRAVLLLRGLGSLMNNEHIQLNSDMLIVAFQPPLRAPDENVSTQFDVTMDYREESHAPENKLDCASIWNSTWLWSKENCHLAFNTGHSVTCRCSQSGNVATVLRRTWSTEKYMVTQRVRVVMLGGCIVCLSAVAVTFVIYAYNLRRDGTEPSVIRLNLLISVAFIQIVYIAGVQATAYYEVCYSVAILLHYLFLVASFWMLSYGIQLYRRLRNSSALSAAVPPGSVLPSQRTRDYCLLSWALPGALVLLSFVVNPRGYEVRRYCWLSIQRGMLLSFIVPISILIVVNTTLMVLVLRHFFAQRPVTHKNEIEKIRCSLRAGVILLPLLAVNWFFGVLALEDSSTVIFEGVFAFTNSLLGLSIFVFYCATNPEIRRSWHTARSLKSKKRPKSAAMKLKKSSTFSSNGKDSCFATPVDDRGRSDVQPLLFSASPPCEETPSSSASFLRV
ncbi:adhesion G protein-coupled receptor L3-like [Ornithodoros turicata]|uniref:adhesion G protein-coupled receptor L3-like n=1 Tax=Ornithodoros turicata TaxID=34597 RepID=UPI003139583A